MPRKLLFLFLPFLRYLPTIILSYTGVASPFVVSHHTPTFQLLPREASLLIHSAYSTFYQACARAIIRTFSMTALGPKLESHAPYPEVSWATMPL